MERKGVEQTANISLLKVRWWKINRVCKNRSDFKGIRSKSIKKKKTLFSFNKHQICKHINVMENHKLWKIQSSWVQRKKIKKKKVCYFSSPAEICREKKSFPSWKNTIYQQVFLELRAATSLVCMIFFLPRSSVELNNKKSVCENRLADGKFWKKKLFFAKNLNWVQFEIEVGEGEEKASRYFISKSKFRVQSRFFFVSKWKFSSSLKCLAEFELSTKSQIDPELFNPQKWIWTVQ